MSVPTHVLNIYGKLYGFNVYTGAGVIHVQGDCTRYKWLPKDLIYFSPKSAPGATELSFDVTGLGSSQVVGYDLVLAKLSGYYIYALYYTVYSGGKFYLYVDGYRINVMNIGVGSIPTKGDHIYNKQKVYVKPASSGSWVHYAKAQRPSGFTTIDYGAYVQMLDNGGVLYYGYSNDMRYLYSVGYNTLAGFPSCNVWYDGLYLCQNRFSGAYYLYYRHYGRRNYKIYYVPWNGSHFIWNNRQLMFNRNGSGSISPMSAMTCYDSYYYQLLNIILYSQANIVRSTWNNRGGETVLVNA